MLEIAVARLDLFIKDDPELRKNMQLKRESPTVPHTGIDNRVLSEC